MRTFLYTLLFSLLPFTAHARWEVKSEFQLQLTESLFDQVIGDFWQSLQGARNVTFPDFSITEAGIPIQFSGVNAELNYSLPVPTRPNPNVREWTLASNNIAARITVNNINASTIIDRIVDGVRFRVRVNAQCNNVSLRLNPGMSSIAATVRAEVIDGQVKLTMPNFTGNWAQGAWVVESLNCTGTDNLDAFVHDQALLALSSFQNFDAEVHQALTNQFVQWSKDASLLLLSERELPTGKDYLQLFYEPTYALENTGGLMLQGNLRFVYPYVSPNQDITQEFKLNTGVSSTKTKAKATLGALSDAAPRLVMPFATIRALMMGEYFAGKLEYSLHSYEIPAFQDFMQSRFKQFFAWPDLMRFPTNTTFQFQVTPSGPPAFDNAKAGGTDTITGDMTLPLFLNMYAPVQGNYMPYVQFRTLLQGASSLTLVKGGKVSLQVQATQLPVSYSWAKQYQQQYNPNTHIAAETMAAAAKDSLSADGLTLAIPNFVVGKSLKLVPEHWQLQSGDNLGLQFTTETSATAAAKVTTARSKK